MNGKIEKAVAVISAMVGVSSVAYGMAAENHVLFVVGLFFVAGSYLIIRRRLKDNGKRRNP